MVGALPNYVRIASLLASMREAMPISQILIAHFISMLSFGDPMKDWLLYDIAR